MVVGDAVYDMILVGEGDSLQAQPPAGYSWEITNIYVEGTARIVVANASDSLDVIDVTESQLNVQINLNDVTALFLIGVGGDATVGYDGIVTRRPPTVFA